MSKSTTVYNYLPDESLALGHSAALNRFIVITPACKKVVKVERDQNSFISLNCPACHHRREQTEINAALKAQKIMPTPHQTQKYAENNNLCVPSLMLESCLLGIEYVPNESVEVEVEVPCLAWIWNYLKRDEQSWQLYAVQDYSDSLEEELTLTPYLLGNVYKHTAGICFAKKVKRGSGITAPKKPNSTSEAYNVYWDSPFTKETSNPNITLLEEWIKNYSPDFSDSVTLNKSQYSTWIEKPVNSIYLWTTSDKTLGYYPFIQAESALIGMKPTLTAEAWLISYDGIWAVKIGRPDSSTKVYPLLYTSESK
jgi:hypothetical protein